MGYDPIDEIQKQTREWEFIKKLPDTIGAFHKKLVDKIEGQILYICRYEAPELKAKADIIYSSETFDYILVRTMGINTYRDMRLIYKERDIFAEKTAHYLPEVLRDMEKPEEVNLGEMVEDKHLKEWEYGKSLPSKIGPFELYIRPDRAIEHINGSVIIIDYTDFSRNDQLIIMYNRLRNEFFGELKINGLFRTTREFDAKNLDGLRKLLEEKLEKTLAWITKADHTI
jgi:hypothetical protein